MGFQCYTSGYVLTIPREIKVSCPLCKAPKNTPIILNNFKRSLDFFHQKLNLWTENELATTPHFFKCASCFAVFRNPQFILPENEEASRYLSHENSLENQRYLAYLSSSIEPFLKYIPENSSGLDFGCGPTRSFEYVLMHLDLNRESASASAKKTIAGTYPNHTYKISSYDKYFFADDEKLQTTYDYIIVHEVIEHFVNFKQEFEDLVKRLKPKGQLFIRTELYPTNFIDFEDWYYKNDSTHVFFLALKTFNYLEKTYNLKFLSLDHNKFILTKN